MKPIWKKWLKQEVELATIPPYWIAYSAKFKQKKWDKQQLIKDTRFVVFDTETTGLDIKKDKILSVGAVSVFNRQIQLQDSFEYFIKRQQTGNRQSIVVHGILQQDTQEGISEADAVQKFIEYIGDAILVGHHVGFDLAMMNSVIGKFTGDKLKNKHLDTVRLAIRFEHFRHTYPTIPAKYTLDNLCERYQIRMSDRHTSAGDAYITAILFIKLISRLENRGVKTLGHLFTR